MLYFLTKWLFIITSKSLARQFKTGLSKRKNQIFLKRAHELDELLVKHLEDIRASAEIHVWNTNKHAPEKDNSYIKMMQNNSIGSFHHQIHYEGEELEIPFKPSFIDISLFESEANGLIIPADIKEAQQKINELATIEGVYENTESGE